MQDTGRPETASSVVALIVEMDGTSWLVAWKGLYGWVRYVCVIQK